MDTLDADDVARFVLVVRQACPGVPVGVTTGAWASPDPAARVRSVRSWTALPDVPDEDAAAWVARQATPLVDGVHRLEPELPVLLHGAEGSTWAAVDLAARLGLDTRVGLEDTTRLPGGTTAAGNAQLVEAALTRVAETRSSRAPAADPDSNDRARGMPPRPAAVRRPGGGVRSVRGRGRDGAGAAR